MALSPFVAEPRPRIVDFTPTYLLGARAHGWAVRAPAPSFSFSPASGQDQVALDATVHVSVAAGRLTSIELTGAARQPPIAGQLDPSGSEWSTAVPLAPATSYRLDAVVVARDGSTSTASSSFTTLAPKQKVTARVAPLNGTTVGVGQPIVVYLTKPVADHAAVERRLTIPTAPAVAGSWRWFSDTELHWRPQAYGNRAPRSRSSPPWPASTSAPAPGAPRDQPWWEGSRLCAGLDRW